MRTTIAALVLAITLLPSCTVRESRSHQPDDQCGITTDDYDLCTDFTAESPHFVVAVIGDGVPDSTMSRKREYPINRAQGAAMWRGINLAFNKSPTIASAKQFFTIKAFDDGGSGECASKIARALYTSPCLLAVIGHATSGTTAEAAYIYQKAGIPLIMPIATSPMVYHPRGELSNTSRLSNAIRLPPSDDKFQTYALAISAIVKLRINSIFLLGDRSTDAETYSKPIFSKLKDQLLGTRKLASEEVTRGDALSIAFTIKKENPELVLFSGYWTNFKPILAALEEQYRGSPKKPTILLSDGCKTDDLETFGFTVYVTFPSPDILATPAISIDAKILKRLIQQQKRSQSYEIFGYDAILLLAQAILDAKRDGISRRSVLNALQTKSEFQGSNFRYRFENGESINLTYYVFDARTKKVAFEITPDDVLAFKKESKLE